MNVQPSEPTATAPGFPALDQEWFPVRSLGKGLRRLAAFVFALAVPELAARVGRSISPLLAIRSSDLGLIFRGRPEKLITPEEQKSGSYTLHLAQ